MKMIELKEIRAIAKELLEYAEKKSEVKEAEAYVSANNLNVYRIAYHTDIPSNGLEEPKSEEDFGLSLRIMFKSGKYGMGVSDSDFSRKGFEEAYSKAFESMVLDNDFKGFAKGKKGKPSSVYADKKILKLDEEKAMAKAYELITGAFSAMKKTKFKEGFNITGEMDALAARMAVENSNGISAAEENTECFSTLTTDLEVNPHASGTSFESSTHLAKLDCEGCAAESAEKSLSMQSPKSLDSGEYKVVLSQIAVAELLYSRFDIEIPSLEYNANPFKGREDERIFSDKLSIDDNPSLGGMICSKKYTDEGIPTKKNTIVKNGVFKNYISNNYYSSKKPEWKKYGQTNGFRGGTGRNYGSDVSVKGTNYTIQKGNHSHEELLDEVKDGIYLGRMWYTYPVNGYSSFDFTSTIRGDSFIIKNGEISSALTPNTFRILDSFESVFKDVLALGKEAKAARSWGQDALVLTPEIAVAKMKLKSISKGIY